jgi:hypothetical protein
MGDPAVGWIAAIIIGGIAGWLAADHMSNAVVFAWFRLGPPFGRPTGGRFFKAISEVELKSRPGPASGSSVFCKPQSLLRPSAPNWQ